jgi:2-polyprenyl-3-methyl-5-hydroxy-6-metoxy-1,4-benzoquinol methylase
LSATHAQSSPVLASPPYRCPVDVEELAAAGDALACARGHRFAVVAGIPRFVSGPTYSDAFGAQWRRYRLTQLDSHTGTAISADRVRRCLGEELWAGLDRLDVLECGCGAGRFTEVLLARGARVTSVDLSDAVDANQENCAQDERHRVAQADLRRLPFAPRSFDVVFCLGVVQHTPEPEQTIASLYEHVKPGGWLVFDHYTRRLGRALSLAPLFRRYFLRLDPETSLRRTETLVDALLPLHRRAGRLRPLLTRVSPVLDYYRTLPQLDDRAQREWALLDTHDALTDRYKHARSRDQIRAVLDALGLVEVWCEYGGNGVEARGRRGG